jgi:CheY-like chemotaxis protein
MHQVERVRRRVGKPTVVRGAPRRRLPVAGRPVCAAPADLERPGAARSADGVRSVLIVDDDPSIRVICRFNLAAAGIDVREAGDGDQALEAIRAERPDLLLLDVMMPRRNGWEVAAELAADPQLRELPVVFCTARADAPGRAQAYELGAVGYIVKPFDPIELAPALEGILERVARGEREALRRAVLQPRSGGRP